MIMQQKIQHELTKILNKLNDTELKQKVRNIISNDPTKISLVLFDLKELLAYTRQMDEKDRDRGLVEELLGASEDIPRLKGVRM